MALNDLLKVSENQKKVGLSEDRIIAVIPIVRDYVSFWREYPDIFVDFMKGENSTFNLFFYQRIFLRAGMRHKYLYATFPRASMAPIPKFFNFGGQIS